MTISDLWEPGKTQPITVATARCVSYAIERDNDAQENALITGYGTAITPDQFLTEDLPAPYEDAYWDLRMSTSFSVRAETLYSNRALFDTLNLGVGHDIVLMEEATKHFNERKEREYQAKINKKIIGWCHVYGIPFLSAYEKNEFQGFASCDDWETFSAPEVKEGKHEDNQLQAIVPLEYVLRSIQRIEMFSHAVANDQISIFHPGFEKRVSADLWLSEYGNVHATHRLICKNGKYFTMVSAENIFDAMMMQLFSMAQSEGGSIIKFCKLCDKAFMPSHGKQEYCGNPCNKDMASKRRARARKKEADLNG